MAAAAQIPSISIKNADEIITKAFAYGLTVTVDTTTEDTLTSHMIRISIPIPVAYVGTELGGRISADSVTMLWIKDTRKGARGRMEEATAQGADGSRKLRSLRLVTACVDSLGRDSARYAREAAPRCEDVVDVPHAVFLAGEQIHPGIPAKHVRQIVSNQRVAGRHVHQDSDGAICIGDRRYVPQCPATEDTVDSQTRPAAEVLAADPIPARSSVLEAMPGRKSSHKEEPRTFHDVLTHDAYVVQFRDSDAWILPNHDDPAEMTRGRVAHTLGRILGGAPGSARFSVDADDTVYLSNGRQAARYIPVTLLGGYTPGLCPGCLTPYASNGDGPCDKGRSAAAHD